ncbi:MAG: YfhO family protein, partial [Bryobacteraceae bacterium]
LDPAQSAVVEAAPRGARIRILNYRDDFYRIRYSALVQCLLRIAVPYYPGWTAAVDGRKTQVVPVDYALSGVIVPAGDHELTFRYVSKWFSLGAILSLITAVSCLSALLFSFFRARSR